MLFTNIGTHDEEHLSLEDMRVNGGLEAIDTVCFAAEHMQQGLHAWSDTSLQAGQQPNLSKYECLPSFWVQNEESRLQLATSDETPCTVQVADQHGVSSTRGTPNL